MRPSLDHDGYRVFTAALGGKPRQMRVCRAVALAFLGVPAPGMVANHKNGHTDDDRIDNLEWCTDLENLQHAYAVLGRTQLWPKGSKHSRAKIHESDVSEILSLRIAGWSYRLLAKRYGVAINTILRVCNKSNWRHVERDPAINPMGQHGRLRGQANKRAKLAEDDVRDIRARRAAGATFRGLAIEFGVDPSTIADAVNGKTWTHVR